MTRTVEERWAAAARAAAARRDTTTPPPAPPGRAPAQAAGSRAAKRRTAAAAAPGVNPFLPLRPGRPPDRDAAEDTGGPPTVEHFTGPDSPPAAPPPSRLAVVLPPVWATPATGAVVQLVGLHGGAGTTTLAALAGPGAIDLGTSLTGAAASVPVLFVTRTHARGLDLALRLGQQWAAGGISPLRVVGLAAVYDAPTLTPALTRTLKSVTKTLPHCWVFRWDENLRASAAPPSAAPSGRLGRELKNIRKHATRLTEKDS